MDTELTGTAELVEALTRTFRRLVIASHDFEEAHSYLFQFKSEYPIPLQSAIATAAIVAYCRPFKRSNPGADRKSDPRIEFDISEVLEDFELTQHLVVIDLRDRGVAHSDFDLKPSERLPSPEGGALSSSKRFSPLVGLDIELLTKMSHKLHVFCITQIIYTNRKISELVGKEE